MARSCAFIACVALIMWKSCSSLMFRSLGRSKTVCTIQSNLRTGITPRPIVGRSFCIPTAPIEPTTQHSYSLQPGITVNEAHRSASEWLTSRGIDEADDSARHIISHATNIGTRYSDFNRNLNRILSPDETKLVSTLCMQRARHVPVQYVIGNWDFYGLTFQCKPPILIPRPETEELVEKILETRLLQNIPEPRILDVGAGTGAVGIALLSQLSKAQCCSIDINPDAVKLANSNAADILGVGSSKRYHSIHADLRTFAKKMGNRAAHGAEVTPSVDEASELSRLLEPFDIIVSNPPYIPSAVIKTLQPEIQDYEDRVALDGGIDGLDIVKDLIYLAPILLKPLDQGGTGELWIEVSEEHPEHLRQWMVTDYWNERAEFVARWSGDAGVSRDVLLRAEATFVEGITDLVGNPRFVRFRFSA